MNDSHLTYMMIGCQNFIPAYQLNDPTARRVNAFKPLLDIIIRTDYGVGK